MSMETFEYDEDLESQAKCHAGFEHQPGLRFKGNGDAKRLEHR